MHYNIIVIAFPAGHAFCVWYLLRQPLQFEDKVITCALSSYIINCHVLFIHTSHQSFCLHICCHTSLVQHIAFLDLLDNRLCGLKTKQCTSCITELQIYGILKLIYHGWYKHCIFLFIYIYMFYIFIYLFMFTFVSIFICFKKTNIHH